MDAKQPRCQHLDVAVTTPLVIRTQGLRSSGAAGPHPTGVRRQRSRGDARRAALADSMAER